MLMALKTEKGGQEPRYVGSFWKLEKNRFSAGVSREEYSLADIIA